MSFKYDTDEMLDIFLFESTQLNEELEKLLLERQHAECFSDEDINEIFRIMHTIKGSAGMMLYDNITQVAHRLEDVFYFLRESHPEHIPHSELVAKALTVSDFINGELEKIRSGGKADGDAAGLLADLNDFLIKLKGGLKEQGISLPQENTHEEPNQFYIAPVASKESRFYRIEIHYKPDTIRSNMRAYASTYALRNVAEDLLYAPEDIITNDESETVIMRDGFVMLLQTRSDKEEIRGLIPSVAVDTVDIEEITSVRFGMGLARLSKGKTEEAQEQENDNPPQQLWTGPKLIVPGDYVVKTKETGRGRTLAGNPQRAQDVVSVSVEKLDKLMELVGEITIAKTGVLESEEVKAVTAASVRNACRELDVKTAELQQLARSMRMTSLANLFQRMRRIVYDISHKLGKKIEMEVSGEDVEVDRNIIEHIYGPLMHLIRNAVDHGIEESPAMRTAAGKPAKGKITLEAASEGGKILIRVEDDGRGMDKQKLYEKARSRGLIEDKPMEEFTDEEIYRFITLPGFSTKDTVTEYSGRGVGMDVVEKNLQAIGGRLTISNREDYGAIMTMTIPTALAVLDGVVIKAGDSSFVIEAAAIKEYIGLSEEVAIQEADGKQYMDIREVRYPLIRLRERFQLSGPPDSGSESLAVLLEHEGRQACVLFDQLVRVQEVVKKPIPSYVKKVRGISGCAQLGDGSIALILDVSGLVQGEERSS